MKRKIIATLLLLFMLIVMATQVMAASYQEQKNNLQNKINEATDQKNQVSREKKTTLEEISDLEESIAKYETELNQLNDKIVKLENNIKSKETEIKELEKEYEEKQQLLTDRLVAIYKEGQPSFLDILLSSDSIASYIAGTTMVQKMAEADNKQMDEVESRRKDVEKAKRELEEQKSELDSSKRSVQSKTAQLKTAKVSKETKVSKLTSEEKAIQSEIEKYKNEMSAIEKKIKEEAAKATNVYQGSFSGTLGWPLSSNSSGYNAITSRFGPRSAPVAGASSNHRGIDIGVGIGTPVYASADGYVLSVQHTSARGIFVLIKHANDLYTRYQHLSSSKVSTGQYVTRGQLIALSGNTGVGSGAHLHFEVLTTPYYMTEINPLTCGLVSVPAGISRY
ncbi:MAG: peptidoglycan DD-metalloendopeptidase family protein [Clostridia bacterium]|nr:peptidoglycan DD-metalloendopeptidase family protein [Clostridia bacterium]